MNLLHTTYYLGDQIKRDEKAGASMRVKNCASRFSVGKSERKIRFGKCWFRWELGLQDGEWINLARRMDKFFQKL